MWCDIGGEVETLNFGIKNVGTVQISNVKRKQS